MNMNLWRRKIIALYLGAILISVLYIPWKAEDHYYNVYEYSWLFNPPEFKSHIAYGIVVLEMVALTIIGAASLECFAFLRWLCK